MYSDEKNVQVVLALLKKAGISKVVISPGSANAPFSRSVQADGFFEAYSAVDERSAAYMACGLSSTTREPVVISCTGATASRNYAPALTEAYYRKLPLVAVMSMNDASDIGNLTTQVIDRSVAPNDVFKSHVRIDHFDGCGKEWATACLEVNRVLAATSRDGGGPVGIEITQRGRQTFGTERLPDVPYVSVHEVGDADTPAISEDSKVLVILGAQDPYTADETLALERFLLTHDAIALSCAASGYHGELSLAGALSCSQLPGNPEEVGFAPDLLIHVGEMTGDYDANLFINRLDCPVWRVSPDGALRKTFSRLDEVFAMEPSRFFSIYSDGIAAKESGYRERWMAYDSQLRTECPELPFSNAWIAKELSPLLPTPSLLHAAILSSMQAWDFFPAPEGVETSANVGGFGIDGCTSTLLGASLAHPDEPCFIVTGDLAFFYDMNALGNRHVGPNLRILLVNNNKGMTFKHSNHYAHRFGGEADEFIAGGGHFINRFEEPRKGVSPAGAWALSLGFRYLSARSKEEFGEVSREFVSSDCPSPILLECFTSEEDEREARDAVMSIDGRKTLKADLKKRAMGVLGEKGVKAAKKILGR